MLLITSETAVFRLILILGSLAALLLPFADSYRPVPYLENPVIATYAVALIWAGMLAIPANRLVSVTILSCCVCIAISLLLPTPPSIIRLFNLGGLFYCTTTLILGLINLGRWSAFLRGALMVLLSFILLNMLATFLRLTSYRNPVYDRVLELAQIKSGLAPVQIWINTLLDAFSVSNLTLLPYVLVFALIGYQNCLLRQTCRWQQLNAWIYTTLIGYSLYYLTPAIGPTATARYPITEGYGQLFWALGHEPRNAFPSLHTTWGLLLLIFAQTQSVSQRLFFSGCGMIMIVATLAQREHWIVDIFPSFALFGLCLWLACPSYLRQQPWTLTAAITALSVLMLWTLVIILFPGMLYLFVWPLIILGILAFFLIILPFQRTHAHG